LSFLPLQVEAEIVAAIFGDRIGLEAEGEHGFVRVADGDAGLLAGMAHHGGHGEHIDSASLLQRALQLTQPFRADGAVVFEVEEVGEQVVRLCIRHGSIGEVQELGRHLHMTFRRRLRRDDGHAVHARRDLPIPSTADSPGLSRTLPFEAILSGFRAAGAFSALGGVEVEMLVEGVAAGLGTETCVVGSLLPKAVRMSQNAMRHKTRQRRMMERRMTELGSFRRKTLPRLSAPKPKTGWDAEHHAANQGHDDEGEPSGRLQTLQMDEPGKEEHQRKSFDDEDQGNRVRHRSDNQIPTRDGQIDKGSIGNHEAEDGHHEEHGFLGFGEVIHDSDAGEAIVLRTTQRRRLGQGRSVLRTMCQRRSSASGRVGRWERKVRAR
jgi:hypothetical protein